MDFLVKEEQIVIETKHNRKNLLEKQITEELVIDIARYSSHPDCKRLYASSMIPNIY